MNRRFLTIILLISSSLATARELPKLPAGRVNFMVLSDSGDKNQERRKAAMSMAECMDDAVVRCNIDFIIHTGDQIHDNGAASANDPEWKFKLLDIYSGDNLQSVKWYAVPGNHEYRGNPDAVSEFSEAHSWWVSPSRYFSRTETLGNGDEVLLVFTDTTPIISKYHKKWTGVKYDGGYVERELAWADSVLLNSDARWKIVLGHHPVHAMTEKTRTERRDMQKTILPLLEKHAADLYINGHIHDFQHIKPDSADIHFVTNASGIKTRKPESLENTIFCSPGPGFMLCSVSHSKIKFFFVRNDGEVIYSYSIKKR